MHEVYRRWRRIADSYPRDVTFVGEVWVQTPERLARDLRPDELHTAFNFDFLLAPWDPDGMRTAIDESIAALAGVGAPTTWVLSNYASPATPPATAAATWAGAGPEGALLSWPCPAAPTSTRATSWAFPR